MKKKIIIIVSIALVICLGIIGFYLLTRYKINAPELLDNMIPVKYEDNNWVYASEDEEWYNYEEKQWANAVVLKPESNEYTEGSVIDMKDIAMMYVWLPRYEYNYKTISEYASGNQKDPGAIDIHFVNGKRTLATKNYKIHPAFTFGDEELTGIWVSKFEISTDSEKCLTETGEFVCEDEIFQSKPDSYFIRNNTIADMFNKILELKNADNYNISNGNTHMIKNSEWGAIAYLTHTIYGRCEDNTCKEVSKNDSEYFTGRSQGTEIIDSDYSEEGAFTYETAEGQMASTTGNIYGVYDLNGGADEYVMGNYKGILGMSGFDALPEDKYIDIYDGELETACNGEECYGHALNETQGWNKDLRKFVTDETPWLIRGGYFGCPMFAGVFGFNNKDGSILEYSSTRVVLVKE